jgi:hypothetical protein
MLILDTRMSKLQRHSVGVTCLLDARASRTRHR